MSGVLSIPNAFANAVTATGAQLDADFNTVTAYINDPTNRNNYVADGGAATNTISLTFAPPVVGGYTAGLEITFKAAIANSGAVVVNANGLGNASLLTPARTALTGGEIAAGGVVKAVHDGTQFIMISQAQNVVAASAATVSAALSNAYFVTPGRMQNHPGVAKAWASFNGTNTGTITALNSYNVGSIVRAGTGTYSISFSTSFANANYAPIVQSSTTLNDKWGPSTVAPGNFIITTFLAGVAADSTQVYFVCFGAQ